MFQRAKQQSYVSNRTMTPQEKYGDEFSYDRLAIRQADGRTIICHQGCVCIKASEDKEATLTFGWQVVRELAHWLITTYDVVPEDERFQIIVAWSKSVRKLQGHIFKIWGFKEGMRTIASCESYREYASLTGNWHVPMLKGEKDVFTNEIT